MASFVLTSAADQDLVDIWQYTYKTWGKKQADRYLDQLEAACGCIATDTFFHRSWSDIHPHLISIHCNHHYLFALYTESDTPIIIAVLHERMNLLERLKERLD